MSTRSSSHTPSLTPSRSPTPAPPVQPDHFYALDSDTQSLPPSPNSSGRSWLSPDDDPFATKGIPVFKPTMGEFVDFEGYMNKVECWGMKSGIVKIIPPKEWSDALPSLNPQLANVRLKSPIEQVMLGNAGLYRQQNVEKNKHMSVREWAEMCAKEEWRAPAAAELELKSTDNVNKDKKKRQKRKTTDAADAAAHNSIVADGIQVTTEDDNTEATNDVIDADVEMLQPESPTLPVSSLPTPPSSDGDNERHQQSHVGDIDEQSQIHEETMQVDDEGKREDDKAEEDKAENEKPDEDGKPASRPKRRTGPTRAQRDAALAERAKLDEEFLKTFDAHKDWLPANMKAEDYTPEFCAKLERKYWRYLGWGKFAWYGADMAGSLFTENTTSWNVAKLPSALTRLLGADKALPGVNTPYLYFGMWRATFAWHVEDMDLFSINYIHFGAGKFWYAIPQGRSIQLENAMKGYFPRDTSKCNQFLRHKSYLASPTLLSKSSCRPNILVQHAGEFVITYPRGYHAGFNLGFNCAESVNFALDSWMELGRKAQACGCVGDSVRIDVDRLLSEREEERVAALKKANEEKSKSRKRKSESSESGSTAKQKRLKVKAEVDTAPKVMLTVKVPPRSKEPTPFPCCLCVSMRNDGLLRVHDKPLSWGGCANVVAKDDNGNELWKAHESCALVVPETWVDEVDVDVGGEMKKEKVVFGVDGIVKDRWNLKCSSCTKTRQKTHGAPIQCTKGKCSKAFHVSCAREGNDLGIRYAVTQEVEKEVVLNEPGANLQQPSVQPNLPGVGDVITPSSTTIDIGGVEPSEPPPPVPSGPTVIKVIKKTEVEVLCSQHNPILAAMKKANKTDRVRKDLLAMSEGARIKLRVSAGVFEVSLVRVIEERGTVEVLWDGGMKKEFKWGSVVWGNMEGQTVGQKPSVAAPPQAPSHRVPTTNDSSYSKFSFAPGQTAVQTYGYGLPGYPYAQQQVGYPIAGAYSTMQPYQSQYQYSYAQSANTFTYNPYGAYTAYAGTAAYARNYLGNAVASSSTNSYPYPPAVATSQQTNSNPVNPSISNTVAPSGQSVDYSMPIRDDIGPTLQDALRDVHTLSFLPQPELEGLLRTKPAIRESIRIVMAHREAQRQAQQSQEVQGN